MNEQELAPLRRDATSGLSEASPSAPRWGARGKRGALFAVERSGLLLIDKPQGISSFDVIRCLRYRFGPIKMGHLGTLDPMATGLLPVFLGKATALIRYFSQSLKTYEAAIELGKSSDTFDREGIITLNSIPTAPAESVVINTLDSFLGTHFQIQPAFSAIRRMGKRAHEFARKGQKVNLGKRQVTIHEILHIRYCFPLISFTMSCDSGTYVRSLAQELGEKLGTGAILHELRRTFVGPFSLHDALLPDEAKEQHIISIQKLIESFIPETRMLQREKTYLSTQLQKPACRQIPNQFKMA